MDTAYSQTQFRVPELTHLYGPSVHLVDDPLALTLLARACARDCGQPEVGRLVRMLYDMLARLVLAAELPRARVDVPTRMATAHPEAVYRGVSIDRRTKVITCGIARAGTLPSQVVYDLLNDVLDPELVRQDHLFMSRKIDSSGRVEGALFHDAKIGRDVQDRILVVPDPMGATGNSLSAALTHYKTRLEGQPAKCIALHLIVTPEYLRKLRDEHPDAIVYALRLDRGLSPREVLAQMPGASWEMERGLDERQYIVPGAGGVGEVLNNAWV